VPSLRVAGLDCARRDWGRSVVAAKAREELQRKVRREFE
jgi:hypothetical protein